MTAFPLAARVAVAATVLPPTTLGFSFASRPSAASPVTALVLVVLALVPDAAAAVVGAFAGAVVAAVAVVVVRVRVVRVVAEALVAVDVDVDAVADDLEAMEVEEEDVAAVDVVVGARERDMLKGRSGKVRDGREGGWVAGADEACCRLKLGYERSGKRGLYAHAGALS